MNCLKKSVSLFLVVIMVLGTFCLSVSASVPNGETQPGTYPLNISVSTDKSSYSAIGTACFTVTITNTSLNAITDISAQSDFNDLAPINSKSEFYVDGISLDAGASITYKYYATVSSEKVSFFAKLILMFKHVLSTCDSSHDNFNDGRSSVTRDVTVDFGSVSATDTITAWGTWNPSLDNGEWVLASALPAGATVTDRKWTYTQSTSQTSTDPSISGWTRIDSNTQYGPWGEWSEWSDTAYIASDAREVQGPERVKIKDAYTTYTYGRWRHSNGTVTALPMVNGVKGTFESKETTSPIPVLASHDGWTEYKNSEYGLWFRVTGFGSDNYGGDVRHEAVYMNNQYRYRDRTVTYFYEKTETKESTTVVQPAEGISNIQEWVRYIPK